MVVCWKIGLSYFVFVAISILLFRDVRDDTDSSLFHLYFLVKEFKIIKVIIDINIMH